MVTARTPHGTAAQLLDVAERLFAERGIDAVSLREIARAAQSRNNSAAHYYFGSKEGLIQALVDRRGPAIRHERAVLLAEARARSAARGESVLPVREVVRIMYLPFIRGQAAGSHFVGFMARMYNDRHRIPVSAASTDYDSQLTWPEVTALLPPAVPTMPLRELEVRTAFASQFVFNALASWEGLRRNGAPIDSWPVFVAQVLAAARGVLTAPIECAGVRPPDPGGAVLR